MKQTNIPQATRLFTDFLYQFDRVRSFYSFAPFDGASLFQAAKSVTYSEETRAAVAKVLEEQSRRFGATEVTRRNLERFRRGAAAVVTGQQVGLFTGPMFAFYKALTAIHMAERLTVAGLDCGAVFPFAICTSICRSTATICSGLYFFVDMTGLPPQVDSLSFRLVQKVPVRSVNGGRTN